MGFRLSHFTITRFRITSGKIRAPFKICVLSDLHECTFGPGNCRLLSGIRKLSPDLVLIAGDLVDAESCGNAGDTMVFLERLARRFPVFYAPGNHEHKILHKKRFFLQRGRLRHGLKAAGVRLFCNESRIFEEPNLRISGLDLAGKYFRKFSPIPLEEGLLEEKLGKADEARFHILAAHDPSRFSSYARYGADLVISGHVHGGIIRLPKLGGLISPDISLFPKYDAGLFRLRKTRMVVCRGIGSHTINLRINNPPELMLLELLPGTDKKEG